MTTATIATAEKKPQNPKDSAAFSPSPLEKVANLKELAKRWSLAVTSTEAHSRKCRPCNSRRHPEKLARETGTLASIDPYKPCDEAVRLWHEERGAMETYRAAGGLFPVWRTR